jgi:hypothetical protein
MSRVDYGQVEVELGGEVLTLRPTLDALEKIDRQFGSIREAASKVRSLNLGALVAVIAWGAELSPREAKALPQQVFDAGIVNVAPLVNEYLAYLLNPSGASGEESDGEGKP